LNEEGANHLQKLKLRRGMEQEYPGTSSHSLTNSTTSPHVKEATWNITTAHATTQVFDSFGNGIFSLTKHTTLIANKSDFAWFHGIQTMCVCTILSLLVVMQY
jgi:hypothetical protein